jgi:hypothetical protein
VSEGLEQVRATAMHDPSEGIDAHG